MNDSGSLRSLCFRDTNLYGYVLNDPVNLADPSGLLVDNFSELYGTARDFRTRYGHQQFPGEANSFMRHCTVTCMVGNQFSPGDARAAGIGNELQGLMIDVSNAQSAAFEISDLVANEAGISAIPSACFIDERDTFTECVNRCLAQQP